MKYTLLCLLFINVFLIYKNGGSSNNFLHGNNSLILENIRYLRLEAGQEIYLEKKHDGNFFFLKFLYIKQNK